VNRILCTFLSSCLLLSGCGSSAENSSFPLTVSDARAELKAMEKQPVKLERPIVIVGGYLDFGIGTSQFASNLKQATGATDDQVLVLTNAFCFSFDQCREKIVNAVQEKWPSPDPATTREVDVVGLSMGGLASRYAALEPGAFSLALRGTPVDFSATAAATTTSTASLRPAGRRLNIHRLFTLSSPHQGAVLADFPTLHRLQLDMRRDSDFITRMNALHESESFPVIPYTRVPDSHVGSAYAAPPGQTPIWLANSCFEASHWGIFNDPRVAADIARRLRGETPYALEPLSPLPR
jgi:hypothetical protein